MTAQGHPKAAGRARLRAFGPQTGQGATIVTPGRREMVNTSSS